MIGWRKNWIEPMQHWHQKIFAINPLPRYPVASARRTRFQHLYSRWVYEDGWIWRKWHDHSQGDPVTRRTQHETCSTNLCDSQKNESCPSALQDQLGPHEPNAALLQTIPQLGSMDRCVVLPLLLGSIAPMSCSAIHGWLCQVATMSHQDFQKMRNGWRMKMAIKCHERPR